MEMLKKKEKEQNNKPIIFIHKQHTVEFVYPKEKEEISKLKYPCNLMDFLWELLGSKGKKNIYLFTYNLDILFEKIKSDSSEKKEKKRMLKIENFKFREKIYVIRIYTMIDSKYFKKGGGGGNLELGRIEEWKKSSEENKLSKSKILVIKDLELFGQLDDQKIKENPESFLKILEYLKKELKVDVNNKFRLSTSSIAMQIFKKNFGKKEELIYRLKEREDNFIRRGYIGGRNEIYKPIVDGKSYYYDINSLYPFIMKTKKVPIGFPTFREPKFFSDPSFNLKNFYGFLEVEVEAPAEEEDIWAPILPFKVKPDIIDHPDIIDYELSESLEGEDNFFQSQSIMENKVKANLGVIYPLGSFSGVYFSEELKYAVSLGYKIKKITKGLEFPGLSIMFDEFVDLIYKKRIEATEKVEEAFWKSMLNTLYGRYALITVNVIKPWEKNSGGGMISDDNFIYDNSDSETITSYHIIKYNNIAIAAAITAYARIHMHDIIFTNKLNPFYWDTDGLFTPQPLPQHLVSAPDSKELGKFRLISENSLAVFISGKFYYYKKEKGENIYVYTFRGVDKPYFIPNPENILELFKQAIFSSNNLVSFIINIPVILMKDRNGHNKGEGQVYTFSFTFYNKRSFQVKEDKQIDLDLETVPWVVNPQSQKTVNKIDN